MPDRAAFYIDGFNLYHAIHDLNKPHLKWLNLWALGTLLIPSQSQTLVRVVWCTATRTDDHERMGRHRAIIKAQEAAGVTLVSGHFIDDPRICRNCDNKWNAPLEKEGDVNLAISLIDDAHRDVFDHAYLITADSDQAATARLFVNRFPQKTLTTISPPGRSHSKHILTHTPLKMTLSVAQLERCLFPKAIIKDDALVVSRPTDYDPPAGWTRPT